nr:SpoVG family protein [uncultured Oscillibacter sp.]
MHTKTPNQLNGHGRIVGEFTAASTGDELVLCVCFADGTIEKAYERRAVSEDSVEVIQHMNRDRNGSYYTTRRVYRSPDSAVVNPAEPPLTDEERTRMHLESLRRSAIRHIRESTGKSMPVKHNLLSTMRHWLDVQAPNSHTREYEALSEIAAAFENELKMEEELTMSKAKTPVETPARTTGQQYPPMQVEVKIHALHTSGPVLANASVDLNGCFAIRGVKVVDSESGPFISMPRYKAGGEYKDVCFPCTASSQAPYPSLPGKTRKLTHSAAPPFHGRPAALGSAMMFHQAVLDAYQQALEQIPQRQQGEAPNPGMGMSM